MSAPVWDDKALLEVYQWREEGRTWAWIGAQGGEEGDAAKVRFSKARSSGRLARVLEGGPATVLKVTPIGDSMTWTEGNGTADLQSRSPRIRTLETLLESAKVDLTRWYVVTHTIKSWDMGAKGPDGNILTEELWAIRATLRAVPGAALAQAITADLIADMDAHAPVYAPVVYPKADGARRMLLVSMADHHIGGLSWWQETGASWDADIAERLAAEAMAEVLTMATLYSPERVTVVIGNDWFHTDRTIDGKGGTTTRGTVQETDGRWQKVFRIGTRAAVGMIDAARALAPVTVICRPGNHDEQTAFVLGDLLDAWYRNDESVEVQNDPAPRVYMQYGANGLGFAHGHNEKQDRLPLLMAAEAPAMWAATVFRGWITGHLHRGERIKGEVSGVQIDVMPSLCADDDYAVRLGLLHRRSCEAIVYDFDDGPKAHLIFNARPDRAMGRAA